MHCSDLMLLMCSSDLDVWAREIIIQLFYIYAPATLTEKSTIKDSLSIA